VIEFLMHLLVIILNREDYLDDILTELVELEITSATVIDGVAMERVLAKDVPIFAGLLQSTRGSNSFNKNIFALVPRKEIVAELIQILKEIDIDLTDPAVGILFTLPVDLFLSAPST
jgi:nitrogen regulatory protein P-II 1